MSTVLQHRRSSVSGSVPSTSAIEMGEIAINTADGYLFIKRFNGVSEEVVQIGASGGGSSVADLTITVDTYVGNGTTTAYSLASQPAADQYITVIVNGVTQHISDYSFSGRVLTFTSAPSSGDDIEIRVYSYMSASVDLRAYQSYVYTITTSTNTITGADDNSLTLAYDIGKVEVYFNGVRLVNGSDYTATNGTSIVLATAVDDSTIEVVSLSKASFIDVDSLGPFDETLTLTTANQVVDTLNKLTYRSAKFLVQMSHATLGYHVTEVLVIHDGTNAYVTEYGTMWTIASLGTVNADISGNNLRLLVTPVNTNTTIKGQRLTVAV